MKTAKWTVVLTITVLSLVLTQGLMAQKSCFLVSNESGPAANDVPIYEHLLQNYVVDIFTGADVNGHVYWPEDFQAYDFGFVSETINSSDIEDLKGAPVPLFITELWASKWDQMGWVPTNTSTTYYENTPEKTVTVIDGDHFLAAGFAAGYETDIVSQSNGSNCLTYSVPQIDHISIAVLSADPTREVVIGVETGTAIYEAQKAAGEFPDGSLVTQNRIAACGISADANEYITEDGWKFIDTGIQWVMGEDSPVESVPSTGIKTFELGQNYPNPFNPTTQINFTLDADNHTTLTVYNAIGQVVDVLVDQDMTAGNYNATFDGQNLNSGVYFYELKSGDQVQMSKMILMK